MIVVDLGLSSKSTRVRLGAVELTVELCNRLPLDVLHDNLIALVVGLYSIIESPLPEGKHFHSKGDL
jgi:hypothetical protein